MTPREIFEQKGRLYKCPNPSHEFSFWRFYGQWTWAEESWSTLTEGGFLHTDFLAVGYTEATNGTSWFRLLVWKLNIHIAYLKENQ
jgi:hypothetical protein